MVSAIFWIKQFVEGVYNCLWQCKWKGVKTINPIDQLLRRLRKPGQLKSISIKKNNILSERWHSLKLFHSEGHQKVLKSYIMKQNLWENTIYLSKCGTCIWVLIRAFNEVLNSKGLPSFWFESLDWGPFAGFFVNSTATFYGKLWPLFYFIKWIIICFG